MLFAPMGSMWLQWVCSDVGVVYSDRCIMGQVVDRHGRPWVMGYGFWIWVDLGVIEMGVDLGVDWRFWI